MRRATVGLVLLLLVTGCARSGLVGPGTVEVGDYYTVDSELAWSVDETGNTEIWTVDGPSLQAIRFFTGLEDGDALFEERTTLFGSDDDEKLSRFRKNMTANDIMEFVLDSLTHAGVVGVTASNLRPQRFGDLVGFRFDMTYIFPSGLEGEALAVGAVDGERLHLILYSGARIHYFPKYLDAVEHIIGSVRME